MECGDIADYTENYKLALELLPDKTNSLLQKMTIETDITKAEKIANNILHKNTYISSAYKVKAQYAFHKKNWQDMCEYQKKLISIRRYDISIYEEFVFMISNALDTTIKDGKKQETEYLIKQLNTIEDLLEETKQSTSSLAYKIVDKPELTLSEEIVKYLQTVKEKNN